MCVGERGKCLAEPILCDWIAREPVMSRTSYLPTKDAALGQWTTHFAAQLATLTTAVGITSAQSATLNTANATWTNALSVATAELTRSRPTVVAKNLARANVLAVVRQLVGIIQKYPGTTDTMRSQLGITVPANRRPGGEPGTPYMLGASLTSTGNLVLKWKNKNAAGCVYFLYRALNGGTNFDALGGTGNKQFTDATIPAGTSRLQYQIQAVRPTGKSQFAILDVAFGNGETSISVTESAPVKIAA